MRRLWTLGCVMLFVACAVSASAFFPESEEIARQIRKQSTSLSSFQAILTFPDDPELSCNLWVKGKAWRQELIETHDGKAQLVQAALGTDKDLAAVFPEQTTMPLPWLMVWKFSLGRWEALGTNPDVLSFQFLVDRPCVVVGARDGDMDSAQCWVDNERHIPVRGLWPSASGPCDLIWDECSQVGNFWLPHRMWFALNHHAPLQVRIRWNGVNIPLQDSLFSKAAFMRQFAGKGLAAPSSSLLPQLGSFPLVVSIRP